MASAALASIATLTAATTATAAVFVSPFSTPPTPPDRNDIFAAEFIEIDGSTDANPEWSFWNDPTGSTQGNRFLRIAMDLRTTGTAQFDVNGIGPSPGAYNVLGSNSTSNGVLTLDSDGWENTLTGSNQVNIGNGNTRTPENGFTSGGIVNWVMLLPDSSSIAAPVQPDNATNERAVAFGFSWEDNNNNNIVDGGDIVSGLYTVTADTFAEMDTVGELNAAVAAIPEPNFGFAAVLFFACTLAVRRRRSF